MSEEDYRTDLTLWAMLAGPLVVRNDIRGMSAAVAAILSNSDLIAIAQDALATKGKKVHEIGSVDIWTRPLSDGATAIALFNTGARRAVIRVKWSQIGLVGQQNVRDLWKRSNLGQFNEACRFTLRAQGAVLLKVSAVADANESSCGVQARS